MRPTGRFCEAMIDGLAKGSRLDRREESDLCDIGDWFETSGQLFDDDRSMTQLSI